MSTYEDYGVTIKRRLRQNKQTCARCATHLSEITRTEQTLAGAICEKRKRATRKLILAVEKLGMDLESSFQAAKFHVDSQSHEGWES